MGAQKKNKKWEFVTFKSRLSEDAVSIGTTALLGLALTQVINPVFVGAAAVYGLGRTLYDLQKQRNGKKTIDEMVKKGHIAEPSEKYKYLQSLVDSFSEAAGAPKQSFMMAKKKILEDALPFGIKLPKEKIKEAMSKFAGAASAANLIITTKEFIKGHSEEGLRFTMAHEVAHARANDSESLKSAFSSTASYMSAPLLIGVAGLVIAGAASIATAAVTGMAIIGTKMLADLGYNYVSRVMERRADRNAIYLTRTPEAALITLRPDDNEPKRVPAILELGTHPSFYHRAENIRKAFAEASQYPLPPTAINPEPGPNHQNQLRP